MTEKPRGGRPPRPRDRPPIEIRQTVAASSPLYEFLREFGSPSIRAGVVLDLARRWHELLAQDEVPRADTKTAEPARGAVHSSAPPTPPAAPQTVDGPAAPLAAGNQHCVQPPQLPPDSDYPLLDLGNMIEAIS
jgi:hypothetical protein